MAGSSQLVKELREKTGAGILDCQKALTENGDDIEKAIDYLRQKGLAAAHKKSGRETNQGLVHAYIHMGGKIGVLIEVNCETDFVARNEEFKTFVNDLALQVAAAKPSYVKREDIPKERRRQGTSHLRRSSQRDGQTSCRLVENRRREAGKVFSGKLPDGAVLHQGPCRHGQRSARPEDREDRREHEYPPLYPLPTRRSMSSAKYRRILLKVSGEMLAGEQGYGIQPSVLEGLAAEIASVVGSTSKSPSSSAAAISSAASPPAPPAWNAPQPTTWACWPRC